MTASDQPPVDAAFVRERLDAIWAAVDTPVVLAPVRERVHAAVQAARSALATGDRRALHAALDRAERAAGRCGVPRRPRDRVCDAVRAIRAELDPTLVQCECGRTRPSEQPPACNR